MRLGKFEHSKIPAPGRAVPGSALVLDGSEVKLRLMAERHQSQTVVHVDWLRFTVQVRNVLPYKLFQAPQSNLCASHVDNLPGVGKAGFYLLDECSMVAVLEKTIRANVEDHADEKFKGIFAQVRDLGAEVCDALGHDFTLARDIKKGRDFYKHILPIERNGQECGWLGFMAATDGPNAHVQGSTIHVNLYGAACTFAHPGWSSRMADIVDTHEGKITRADLALDFFDGFPGGLDKIKTDFDQGLCSSNGRRLKCNMVGDWSADPQDGRSFYWGSKEAGKQTNAYEKGHQLFGFEYGSAWLRVELRYGNKLRVLESDILRRPSDFFAGASDYHQALLAVAESLASVSPQVVPAEARLPVLTVEAEVHRMVRWTKHVAGPSMAALVQFATFPQLFGLLEHLKLPGRLQKFSESEITRVFQSAVSKFTTVDGCSPVLA